MELEKEETVKKEKQETANSIAINMIKQGFSTEAIASITSLTIEEIKKLQNR